MCFFIPSNSQLNKYVHLNVAARAEITNIQYQPLWIMCLQEVEFTGYQSYTNVFLSWEANKKCHNIL